MEGEVFHLIDREILLARVKSLDFNTPERLFLLGLMDNSIRIHKPAHNYHIDRVIELDEKLVTLEKCKI